MFPMSCLLMFFLWNIIPYFNFLAVAEPIAIHQLILVNSSSSELIRFRGYDKLDPNLIFNIKSLPSSGSIYQLSKIFSDYSYPPMQGSLINVTNTIVTGSQSRILYKRPALDKESNHLWDRIKFTASSAKSSVSQEGFIVFVPPSGLIMGSNFLLSNEEWSIVGNKELKSSAIFEPYSRGPSFKGYIYGSDDEVNLKSDGIDSSLWYFQAPSKFTVNNGIAYGGRLSFSMLPFSGDMSKKYSGNIPVVELECKDCPGPVSLGQKLVFPIAALKLSVFASSPWMFDISLLETSGWLKSSQNTLNPWLPVSQCDMIQVLSRLSNFRILGDWTRSFETIALDDVIIKNTKVQLPLCGMKRTDASVCDCAN